MESQDMYVVLIFTQAPKHTQASKISEKIRVVAALSTIFHLPDGECSCTFLFVKIDDHTKSESEKNKQSDSINIVNKKE